MLIRRELPSDAEGIAAVHRSAFGDPSGAAEPVEVGLVDTLRTSNAWIAALSLVAERDGVVVGHVCLTRATVGTTAVAALGPIGVVADCQNAGIGSALMHTALGAADALDIPLVGLLGSHEYYARFGFVAGEQLGIRPSEPSWASHFQVRRLARYEPTIIGEFCYAEVFYRLE